ncbi:MAG TPA: hypothetical protein G4N92_08945 [Anaerolineae bacterium]|nr:hypothetical protein [Anaerolineae bacterium]
MNIWEEIKDVFKNFGAHMRTGASYMLGALIIGSLATALGNSLGQGQETPFWDVIRGVGQVGMDIFPAVLGAYMAFSIADTPAIGPGLVLGILAKQSGTGYIGAMVSAILVGILIRIFMKGKVGKVFQMTYNMFAPVVATLVIGLFMGLVLAGPIEAGLNALITGITNLGQAGKGVMGALLGGLQNVDFGGPISKSAMTVVNALFESGINTAYGMVGAAVFVPPLGVSIAALIAKKYFTDEEYEYAKGGVFLSILGGFTELVIQYAVNDFWPVTIASAVGGAVAGAIAGITELGMLVPILGIGNLPFWTNTWVYIGAVLAGTATTIVVVLALKALKYNRKKAKGKK